MHGTYVFRSVTYIPRTRKQGCPPTYIMLRSHL